MSGVQRTILYNVGGEDCDFSIERWFIASPEMRQESVTRLALVWTHDEEERVVLFSPSRADEVAQIVDEFVMDFDK